MSNFATHARFESFFSRASKLPSFKRDWGGMRGDALSGQLSKNLGKYSVFMNALRRGGRVEECRGEGSNFHSRPLRRLRFPVPDFSSYPLRLGGSPSLVGVHSTNESHPRQLAAWVVQCLMGAITSDEARAYFERWDLVRDAETEELRRTSMDTKLRQLESLMASRLMFGPEPDREEGIGVVRARWNTLRQALGG